MTKKLTKSELLQMENNLKDQQLLEKDLELLNNKKTVELLSIKIKQLEAQMKIISTDNDITSMKSKINQIKGDNREFNNKLKTKYKIKGGFGINPDTGEIITDE